ncbi:hypothetical protein JTE90_007480 [Oedothorax gibbosus]|uniref:Kynureninase n=1 Tax=Oedothorax gibbosus TaxID=931172 RepID=A0AAV6U8Y1_9ARAC|nr:hypothetical protein JTE90_007480 [Oedothorax gibbosus]
MLSAEIHRNGLPKSIAAMNPFSEKNTNISLAHEFLSLSSSWSLDIDSKEFAKKLDDEDPLKEFRKRFHYPKKKGLSGVDSESLVDDNEECIYLCGQSLGLQLKTIKNTLQDVLYDWASRGVECHFNGYLPAAFCDVPIKDKMAYLVGAQREEVAIMNGLTVNIHMMLGTFYNPTSEKHKVLMLAGGFHSDLYAVQSHVSMRGYDPEDSIIFLNPRKGEYTINPNDIMQVIEEEGHSISLIFLEGVHYYTGQLFDMKEITAAGHAQGCIVGWDLAHAVGNVKLKLHDWKVDFAVWCTYKYLNSGPGSLGAIFSHSRHTQGVNGVLPSMAGWWGLPDKKKFAFEREFCPSEGADRFRNSNPSPFLSTMVLANIEVFREAGLERLRKKQRLLTGYMEYLIETLFPCDETRRPQIQIITPSNPNMRGSQLSLVSSVPISMFEDNLKSKGVLCDARKPSVIRVTPIPLYNTFTEVYEFVHILKNLFCDIPYTES